MNSCHSYSLLMLQHQQHHALGVQSLCEILLHGMHLTLHSAIIPYGQEYLAVILEYLDLVDGFVWKGTCPLCFLLGLSLRCH